MQGPLLYDIMKKNNFKPFIFSSGEEKFGYYILFVISDFGHFELRLQQVKVTGPLEFVSTIHIFIVLYKTLDTSLTSILCLENI